MQQSAAAHAPIKHAHDVQSAEAQHPALELLQLAAAIGCADQCADGRASHDVRADFLLRQRFQNADVGPASGGPATQRQADAQGHGCRRRQGFELFHCIGQRM